MGFLSGPDGRTRYVEVPTWVDKLIPKRRAEDEETDRMLLEIQWTGGPRADGDPVCRRYGHSWGHPERDKGMDCRCKRCGVWRSGKHRA